MSYIGPKDKHTSYTGHKDTRHIQTLKTLRHTGHTCVIYRP